MFVITHQDFEKVALNLSRLARNIDADSVVGIIDDNGKSLSEKIKDAVVKKIEDRFVDVFKDSQKQDNDYPTYHQPSLKEQFKNRFRFKKIAANVFHSRFKPMLEGVGIAANEQALVSMKVKKEIKDKFGKTIGLEDGGNDDKRYDKSNYKGGFVR